MPVGPHSAAALVHLPLGDGTTPRILLNPDGRGIALWLEEVAGERQIVGKVIGSGENLAHVVFRTLGQVKHLQAAVDRRGNALMVWLHEKDGLFEVMAQSFDARGMVEWEQTPTSLGLHSTQAMEPRLAVNYREHAMVLWEVRDSFFEGLVASHFWPSDRIWSDRPVPVVSHATHQHQVVMDDQGNALALWIRPSEGQRSRLEASFYDGLSGEWETPVPLGSARTFSSPRLVMSGEGEALAAWCQGEDRGTARLFAKAFVKGKWEVERHSLDPGQGPITDLALALGTDGQAGILSVHHGPDGDGVTIHLRRSEWTAPAVLGAHSDLTRSAPQLRICAEGAFALWIQGEGEAKALVLAKTS